MSFKRFYFLFLFIAFAYACYGQVPKFPVKINIQIPVLANQEICVAYYYLDKTYVKDTLKLDKNGKVLYMPNDSLERGMYLLYSVSENKTYCDFIIDKEFTFDIKILSWQGKHTATFTGSSINTAYANYLNTLNRYREEADSIRAIPNLSSQTIAALFTKYDDKVKNMQDEIIRTQNNLFGKIIRISKDPDYKLASNSKADSTAAFYKYREDYINRIDFKDPALMHCISFMPLINNYLEKLTVKHQDSLVKSCDILLKKTGESGEMYRALLITLLNKFATSKYVHEENVYVHLVKNYYAQGKTPWIENEELQKIIKSAEKLEPSLLGKAAFDFELPDILGNTKKLSAQTEGGILLLFFDASCGKCKESLRKMAEAEKTYASKGVKFITIQMNATENSEDAKKVYSEMGLEKMLNLICYDKILGEKIKQKYNLVYYPQFFLLDKNKKIYFKSFGSDQLEELLISYLY